MPRKMLGGIGVRAVVSFYPSIRARTMIEEVLVFRTAAAGVIFFFQ